MKKRIIWIVLLIFLLTACAPTGASPSRIEVSQASVRLLSGDMPAVGYMLIKNTGGTNDRLMSVGADFADRVMLHKTSVDAKGVARMEMVMAIDVPAGQQVALKPGGFHLSLEGLNPQLKAGDTVMLTLEFEQAGMINLEIQITGQ